MNSEQITAFLQEHWYIASVLIGAVILIGAIRNWNWLCDPTGTRDAHRHSRGYRRVVFFLLDELSPRDEADGRATFTLPGMAFARDGSGGEYHLLEDGSIGYYSSEGEAGRLAESMADLFSLLVNCICWHDCCDTKQYVDSKTLEEYGQRQRNCNLEDMDMDSLRRVSDALGIPTDEPLAPVLERFRKATQREPLYQCIFHEDDGSLTESYGLMFE